MLQCPGRLDYLLQRWVLLHCKVHHLVIGFIGLLPFMFLSSKIIMACPGVAVLRPVFIDRDCRDCLIIRSVLFLSSKVIILWDFIILFNQLVILLRLVILYKLVILFAPLYLFPHLLNFIPRSPTVSYLLLHKTNAS